MSDETFAFVLGTVLGAAVLGLISYGATDSYWRGILSDKCQDNTTLSFVYAETAYEMKCEILNKIDLSGKK